MARYRWRTWLRVRAPMAIAHLIAKGNRDCGRHEWYRHDATTYLCYHCDVGHRRSTPDADERS